MRILTIARMVWIEMIRRKDIYVLLILLGALLMTLLSLDVFGASAAGGYVKDIGLSLTWLMSWILAINVSTRQLPQEETRGTVFSLLAKPIRRTEIIVGKWLGAWLVTGLATLTAYALLTLVLLLKGAPTFQPVALIQALLLHAIALAIIAAIGIAASTRMAHDAAATLTYILTIAAFLLVPRIPTLLARNQGGRESILLVFYYALPHFELFDMRQRLVHDWGLLSMVTVLQVALYGVILIAFFLGLACAGYQNRRFSRKTME